jgi:hypothetical protein
LFFHSGYFLALFSFVCVMCEPEYVHLSWSHGK